MSDDIWVRFANETDTAVFAQDPFFPNEVMLRKMTQHEVIIAERQGLLAGSMRFEYHWSMLPFITFIRVQPEYRLQGIGKALLAYLEAFPRNHGYTSLYSSSQADEPEPQAWHRRMGFTECGIIAGMNDGGVGEIFFRKEL